MKIQSSLLSTQTSLGARQPPLLARAQPHPLAVLLFGKRPPKRVDRRRHPKLRRALKRLEGIAEQISEHVAAGRKFPIDLCEGDNASISRDGRIAIGVELLGEHPDDDDLWVAILGHEIGHRPWTWPQGDLSRMKPRQLEALYRAEEAKADRFAGRMLAELDADPAAVCAFLLAHEAFEGGQASRAYDPAPQRAALIRAAFEKRRRALQAGRKVFGRGKRDLR